MNIKSVLKMLSVIMLLVAAFMLVPLAMAGCTGDWASLKAFLYSEIIVIVAALATQIATGYYRPVLGQKESILVVAVAWVVMTAFGALPLYFSGEIGTYTKCFYEVMSGFTTTGATSLDVISVVSKPVLLWRSMTNWIGGIGVIVIFVAVLPVFGVGGTSLVGAESTGPTKSKIAPTMRRTALILFLIYLFFSVLETVLLIVGHLSVFDAVTLTCGTIANAGYTVTDGSVAAYSSSYVEWICIIFMFIGGANFSLYYYPLIRQPGKMLRNGEFRMYGGIALVFSLFVAVSLFVSGTYGAADSVRRALFHVISILSTTGFTTVDYNSWPSFAISLLFVCCFIGGCAGSAAGGIKVSRVFIILKMGKNSIKERIHPSAVFPVRVGDEAFDRRTGVRVAGFVGLYILTILAGTVFLSLSGSDMAMCFSASVQAVGNIGIGFGGIGTTMSFSIFPDWALWGLSFLMLAGRLELFTIYSVILPSFWKR